MYRIPQRIKDGRILDRNRRIKLPDVRFGDGNVLCKCAVGIYADDFHVLANVRFASATLQALSAGDVHFGGNKIAFFYTGDFVSTGDYFTAELVSGNQWRMDTALCPAVPLINMQVGAADGCYFDLDQNVGAPNLRNFYLPNLCSRCGTRFHHC